MKGALKFIKIITLIYLLFIVQNIRGNPASSDITRADTLHILHYDIHLDIMNFSTKQIKGYTDVTVTPFVDNVSNIALDLLKLNVDSILISYSPSGSQFSNLNSQFTYNNTLIQIPLSKLIKTTDTIKLRVYYHGQPQLDPSSNHWGGFFFSGNYAYNLGVGMSSNPHPIGRFWYPCLDDFKSRSLYDFYIRTEKTHTAVCNGLLVNVADNGDNTRTFHWHLNETIPTYLASVAVSDYAAVKDTYNGIKRDIPIAIYVNPGDTSNTKASFINLKSVLRIFEKDFGPYLWDRVGYVGVPFLYGAMEHATNIAYPNYYIDGTTANETLYIHELSHLWFGDLVTCSSAEDMWLNEGWAEYCQMIYREELYGKKSYIDYIRDNHINVLQYIYISDNGYRAIYGNPSDYTYCGTVYNKGADVVYTLRNYLGDSLFFKTVKAYLNKFSFNNATTSEFKDFFSSNTGLKLDDFFNTWVYGKGFPHFSVDSFKVGLTDNLGSRVQVFLRQRLRGTDIYGKSNKLEITFMSDDWKSYTDTIIFSGEYGNKIFMVPFTPDIVIVDKEEKVTDATTDNYMTIKNTGTYTFPDTYFEMIVNNIKDSAFVRAEHNWVAPDKLKKPNNGIYRISSERYWKIDGIFPEGFNAKGSFFYSKTTNLTYGYLDNRLLPNLQSSDSLILLYRKNTSEDWRSIVFTKKGGYTNGYIYADNIKPGEYCFGIGKPFQSVESIKAKQILFNVFPNPGAENFDIEYEINENATIDIYDIKDAKVDSFAINRGHNTIKWNAKKISKGTYILKLYTSDKKFVTSKTVIKN